MKNVFFKKHQHPYVVTSSNGTKNLVYLCPLFTDNIAHRHACFSLLNLPVMFWFILHTLLLHVCHHFHAVRVKMVTNIQIIVCEINQNITHKAGFFLYKIKQVRAQKNAR